MACDLPKVKLSIPHVRLTFRLFYRNDLSHRISTSLVSIRFGCYFDFWSHTQLPGVDYVRQYIDYLLHCYSLKTVEYCRIFLFLFCLITIGYSSKIRINACLSNGKKKQPLWLPWLSEQKYNAIGSRQLQRYSRHVINIEVHCL